VPDQCWSQERLLDLASALLLGPNAQLAGYVDQKRLRQHLSRQRDARFFNVYQIWEMLVLEQWLRNAARGAVARAA
jgi:hypothetical protein